MSENETEIQVSLGNIVKSFNGEGDFISSLSTDPSFYKKAPDLYYIVGMYHYHVGEKDFGRKIMSAAIAGGPSQNFFRIFGSVIGRLGDQGEKLRLALWTERLLPMQFAAGAHYGATEGVRNGAVQPWGYVASRTRPFPRRMADFQNLYTLVRHHIAPGWAPKAPLFKRSDQILTVGSCFAMELRNVLCEQGMSAEWMLMPPDLHNSFAMKDFFYWCATGDTSDIAYWHDLDAQGGAAVWAPQEEQQRYRAMLSSVSGLILTVGLAEVWSDKDTGKVFWRGVPKEYFNPEKHVDRLSTVEENEKNLNDIITIFRQLNPSAPVIITLSPVPLRATSRGVSCITADCLSKSILRVAIDNVVRAQSNDNSVYYWPSFEIVKWSASHIDAALFGDDGDTRHVNRPAVKCIVDNFIDMYFEKK